MQAAGEFGGQDLMHGARPRDPALPGKGRGNHPDAIVSLATGGGARMAGMAGTVVGDLDQGGGEGGGKCGVEPILTVLHPWVIGRLPIAANGALAPPAIRRT